MSSYELEESYIIIVLTNQKSQTNYLGKDQKTCTKKPFMFCADKNIDVIEYIIQNIDDYPEFVVPESEDFLLPSLKKELKERKITYKSLSQDDKYSILKKLAREVYTQKTYLFLKEFNLLKPDIYTLSKQDYNRQLNHKKDKDTTYGVINCLNIYTGDTNQMTLLISYGGYYVFELYN